jgi:hypothetical protein
MALYQLIYWNPHAVVILSHTQVVDAGALQSEAQGAASDAAQVPPTNLLSTLLTFTSFILQDLCMFLQLVPISANRHLGQSPNRQLRP